MDNVKGNVYNSGNINSTTDSGGDNATNGMSNFISDIIESDNAAGTYKGKVHTRFPPEPNGYLHIGHAKAICLDFGMAAAYGGKCNLRFDDTNPAKEDTEYVDSIMEDIRWLGFDWEDRLYYASDYFEKLYGYAVDLIKLGKAFVCDLTAAQIREFRGTLTEPGADSPYRNRLVAENLELFEGMRSGKYPDGSRVLRAKIDMASPNINMRDPVIYRILRATHHRTGDKWCIYPMYDYAHPLSDYIEGITHSICTLEFEAHRPLYDWFLKELGFGERPKQIEFARLNLNYTVMSKRKLLELVREGYVDGWDDPRMPTLSGMRRRGYTPESIRDFTSRVGVAKTESTVDISLLEHCVREDLNKRAARVMAVLRPLKVVIDNYEDGRMEMCEADNNPEDPSAGTRMVPFSKVIYIERDDFMEEPPKGYYRLSPGAEVRLKNAYLVRCVDVVRDPVNGGVAELHCIYDPESKGGNAPDGRKVKGTLHWVSAAHAIDAEVKLYSSLFSVPDPMVHGKGVISNNDELAADEAKVSEDSEGGEVEPVTSAMSDFKEYIDPDSVIVLKGCKLEPSLANAKPGTGYQFMRLGYFTLDIKAAGLVFNRTVTLKDTWSKKNL